MLDASHREHSITKLYGPTAFTPGAPASLRLLVDDYVDHLLHHLRIIDPELVEPSLAA